MTLRVFAKLLKSAVAPKAAPINAMTTTASLLCKAERLLEANGPFDQDGSNRILMKRDP